MAFGFKGQSGLGAALASIGRPPPMPFTDFAPTPAQPKPAQAGAPSPGAQTPLGQAAPATVPAGASSGPGYIPGIYGQMPGMVDAAPASSAVGDAAAGGAAASGGPGVMRLLMHLFGA